ncbi:hypothetical protein [Erythrobacter crassostreae]|uniref:Uncharacterized protein n=1 Tax=Erythrobacter crassostreae TaxID=2828328 RepID=A0A9X1JJY4_9SPHN|nr:hypothetical protein [Erythrobacter crassostrea]MBV7258430.1 hypothetical protein [Erythrobacter crassostrea]
MTSMWVMGAVILIGIAPVAAITIEQDEPPPALEPDNGTLEIDLKAKAVSKPQDPILVKECEDEADAARLANEIVVCRRRDDTAFSGFDKADFERRYAEATQGPKPVPVDRSGLRAPGGAPMAPLVTVKFGRVAEPSLFINVAALPKAPAGSDADRIARGLPPLGAEGDAGRKPIAESELGLPAPREFKESAGSSRKDRQN